MSAPSLPATVDRIVVEFPSSDGYRGVGRLVLGGLVSRFELPLDRVEDLLLAVESVLVQPLAGDTISLEASAARDGLHVRLGPFAGTPLADPAVSRVLTRLVDEVSDADDDGGTRIELHVAAARLTAPAGNR